MFPRHALSPALSPKPSYRPVPTHQTSYPRSPPLARKIIHAVRNDQAVFAIAAFVVGFAIVITVVLSAPIGSLPFHLHPHLEDVGQDAKRTRKTGNSSSRPAAAPSRHRGRRRGAIARARRFCGCISASIPTLPLRKSETTYRLLSSDKH
jgi:hypothetical protein